MIIKTKRVDKKKVLEENVWIKLKGDLYFGQSTYSSTVIMPQQVTSMWF